MFYTHIQLNCSLCFPSRLCHFTVKSSICENFSCYKNAIYVKYDSKETLLGDLML